MFKSLGDFAMGWLHVTFCNKNEIDEKHCKE